MKILSNIASILKKGLPIFGLILFIFILSRINFSYYLNNLPQINWQLIAISPLLLMLMILIKAKRWQILLKKQNFSYPLWQIFLSYLSGIYFGAITPGRLGELGRVVYLDVNKQNKISLITTTFLDRIFDLALVLAFGLISLGWYYRYLNFNLLSSAIIALTLTVIAVFFIYLKKISPQLQQKLSTTLKEVKNCLKQYNAKDHFNLISLTILAWLIYFFMAYILTLAVGITTLPFWFVALVMNIAAITNLLPISIMGLGTRETIFIFFYALKNQPQELAIAVSMLILITNFFSVGLGFFTCLTHKKWIIFLKK